MKTNFFEYLDFALQFAPAGPRKRKSARNWRVSASARARPSPSRISRPSKRPRSAAWHEGGRRQGRAVSRHRRKDINGWKVGSLFGDRAFYHGDWLKRAAAAKGGIYGNDAVEAMYPMTKTLTRWRAARRQQAQLHAHLRRRTIPASECLLVGDDV